MARGHEPTGQSLAKWLTGRVFIRTECGMRYIICFVLCMAFPLHAETVVSPDAFEKLSTGKTLYFSHNGAPYGAEQFFTGRRSKWRYSDGQCEDGQWFTDNDLICFKYKNKYDTQCWYFLKTDQGYAARAENAPADEIIVLDFMDTKPLLCVDPDLSV